MQGKRGVDGTLERLPIDQLELAENPGKTISTEGIERLAGMLMRLGQGDLRDRARTGRYAYVHGRGPDFAAGIWVIDPVFMLDAIH